MGTETRSGKITAARCEGWTIGWYERLELCGRSEEERTRQTVGVHVAPCAIGQLHDTHCDIVVLDQVADVQLERDGAVHHFDAIGRRAIDGEFLAALDRHA